MNIKYHVRGDLTPEQIKEKMEAGAIFIGYISNHQSKFFVKNGKLFVCDAPITQIVSASLEKHYDNLSKWDRYTFDYSLIIKNELDELLND